MTRKNIIRKGFLSGLLLCGCGGGPQVVEHQRIQGVDTDETRVNNPHDGAGEGIRKAPAPEPDDCLGAGTEAPTEAVTEAVETTRRTAAEESR